MRPPTSPTRQGLPRDLPNGTVPLIFDFFCAANPNVELTRRDERDETSTTFRGVAARPRALCLSKGVRAKARESFWRGTIGERARRAARDCPAIGASTYARKHAHGSQVAGPRSARAFGAATFCALDRTRPHLGSESARVERSRLLLERRRLRHPGAGRFTRGRPGARSANAGAAQR